MNRRSFIKGMLAAGVASMWLPGAGRIWRPVMAETIVAPAETCCLVVFYTVQELIAALHAQKKRRHELNNQQVHALELNVYQSPYFKATRSIYEALHDPSLPAPSAEALHLFP